ncbi:hypothetical protein BS78_02G397300 [Paspalum vaginatum]|nr:hypothetical protein BS78_02G397300 [Paspalum vaginatum]
MASTATTDYSAPFLGPRVTSVDDGLKIVESRRRPLLIRFSDDDDDDQEQVPTIIDPFDDDGCLMREATTLDLEILLRGKQRLACLQGEWLLMLDDDTHECFMVSLASPSLGKISPPPLAIPVEHLFRCALSSLAPPDCTIMFTTDTHDDDEDNYLMYCRPGDKEWWVVGDDDDETTTGDDTAYCYGNEALCAQIVGSRGTMYMRTDMDTFIAIDASLSCSASADIRKKGIPHSSPMRWGRIERLVECGGDVLYMQFYTHGLFNSEVIDMDIHSLDTSTYVWEKVESIDATLCQRWMGSGDKRWQVYVRSKSIHRRDGWFGDLEETGWRPWLHVSRSAAADDLMVGLLLWYCCLLLLGRWRLWFRFRCWHVFAPNTKDTT